MISYYWCYIMFSFFYLFSSLSLSLSVSPSSPFCFIFFLFLLAVHRLSLVWHSYSKSVCSYNCSSCLVMKHQVDICWVGGCASCYQGVGTSAWGGCSVQTMCRCSVYLGMALRRSGCDLSYILLISAVVTISCQSKHSYNC